MKLQKQSSGFSKSGKTYSKWVLTIPKEIVDELNWKEGQEIIIEKNRSGKTTLHQEGDNKNIGLLICDCLCHDDGMSFCSKCNMTHSMIIEKISTMGEEISNLVKKGYTQKFLKDGKIEIQGIFKRTYDLTSGVMKTIHVPK